MSVAQVPSTDQPGGSQVTARQIYDIVRDLIRPQPAVYWFDFLGSMAIGWTAFFFYLTAPNLSIVQMAGLAISCIFFYRSWIFTHELAHLGRGKFRAFRVVWNAICGIPFMIPSFLYGDHKGHHVNHSYGTENDAEYLPLGVWPLRWMAAYIGLIFVTPFLAPIRFMLLTPLVLVSRTSRRIIWTYTSSLALINPVYRRPLPEGDEARGWLLQETLCCIYGWSIAGLMIAGLVPWQWLPKIYLCYFLITAVNYIRALGAHRYRNNFQPMTYVEQLLDSNTFPGRPLFTELWAPVGMRYHALHHLVPSLPYHNMGKAHRRLVAQLPAGSPYHRTIQPNLAAAIWSLYCCARGAGR